MRALEGLAVLALVAAPALGTSETFKLLATGGGPGDTFGNAVAASGQLVAVGARNGTGSGALSGAAYVFNAVDGTQITKLVASDGAMHDGFGESVALSGSVTLVGATYGNGIAGETGCAYLFDAATGGELGKLFANDGAPIDEFGFAVDLDGDLAVVGAIADDDNGSTSGSAYVFDVTTGLQLTKLLPTDGAMDDVFGVSVAIRGTTALVGSVFDDDNGPLSGSAYVFDATTGAQLAKLLPTDGGPSGFFGSAVALDDTTALIGSRGDDQSGYSAGAAYVFDLTSGLQTLKLLALNGAAGDSFGAAVALDGASAVVGAWGNGVSGFVSGTAYHFDASTGAQLAELIPSDGAASDLFGSSVALACGSAVVGSPGQDEGGLEVGAAYLFAAGAAGPQVYCTAGASGSGCSAGISAAGSASASSASGFTLAALSVEGDKDGLFFFGTRGRQANPWGNGSSYQCLVPPVKRGGLLAGVGTSGACDGSFFQDLNALWCASCPKPLKNPGAGSVVQAQLWYRDPFSSSNRTSSLSNAIEFCVAP
jgi:hypothetical protein